MSGIAALFGLASPENAGPQVEFWKDPERTGWLMKQGEYIKTWRRRWFVLKQGQLFWFKEDTVTRESRPRGVVNVGKCLTVKGAEDILNKPFAFELSTTQETMFFIADNDKDKEDWINSVGRAIVRHSRSVTDYEVYDYDSKPKSSANEEAAAVAGTPVLTSKEETPTDAPAAVASGSPAAASPALI